MIFFFFSSRRRHTRCSRDWSSDVCSSDLQVPAAAAFAAIEQGATWLSALPASTWTAAAPNRAAGSPIERLAAGATTIPSPERLAPHGLYMPALDGATGYSWEFLASLAASGFPSYSYVAATTSDSVPAGNPRTAFLLQARGVSGGAYWSSAPDSGYSVDNLPPAMPAP